MIPTPRLLALGAALAASSLLVSFFPGTLYVWLLLPGLLLVCMAWDLLCVYRIKLSGERIIRQVLSHGQWTDVTLKISNTGTSYARAKIHDMHPQQFRIRGLDPVLDIDANAISSISYEGMPEVRGNMLFEGIDCMASTRLGLWYRQSTLGCNDELKVYPNYKNNKLFALLLSNRTLDNLGVRRLPRPGEGSDFHQLREYRDGDSLRQIDWKSTARMQKLIAREYAQERDQQVIFLLDCSMRMRHQDANSSHMDDTLNAIVLLSHVALQQGDATGIMTFGGVDRWIPPSKGMQSARRLMHGLYDLEATRELPDYVQAVETLAVRLRRRALIILITNLRNEDGQSALNALQRLKGKHLVVMADLQESDLDTVLKTQPNTTDEAMLWLSAEQYRLQRKQQHKLARAGGATLLDVTPGKLSAELITRYLSIKRLGRL